MNTFIQVNITPLLRLYHDAICTKHFEEAGDIYLNIRAEIESASTIFPKAIKDIETLKNLQSTLWQQLQARSVEPMHITGANAHPEMMKDLAPVGITNIANDCWANAILQLIANAPGIARQVLAHRNKESCRVFASQLQSYYDAQIQAKPLSDVNSQQLRKELMPGTWIAQVDAMEGLQRLFSTIKFGFKIYEEFYIDKRLIEGDEREQAVIESMISLTVDKNSTFEEQFYSSFTTVLQDGRTKKTKFESTPNDLIIHVKRYGEKQGAILEGIPETFELPSEYTRWNEKDVHYELTGCMIHLGKDGSGHYIALEKKPDGWYLANDSVVDRISPHRARELLKTGYMFHYRKAKPARTCGSIIYEIAMPLFQIAAYPFQSYWNKLVNSRTRSL